MVRPVASNKTKDYNGKLLGGSFVEDGVTEVRSPERGVAEICCGQVAAPETRRAAYCTLKRAGPRSGCTERCAWRMRGQRRVRWPVSVKVHEPGVPAATRTHEKPRRIRASSL